MNEVKFNSTILDNLTKYKARGIDKKDANIIFDCDHEACIGQDDILLPIYSPAEYSTEFYLYLNC